MESTTLLVMGMSCEHCVRAVNNAVGDLSGVSDVRVSLKDNTVAITYDAAKTSLDRIKEAILEQGYEVL